jgi:hypothetical protein
VALNFGDESVLILATGLKPAVALKRPLQRLLAASVGTRF